MKITDIKKQLIISDKELCVGDVNHNNVIKATFKNVKSNKLNVDISCFIRDNMLEDGKPRWYFYSLTKTQMNRLGAIMRTKSKDTLQKRVYAFSYLISSGAYAYLFNKHLMRDWKNICERNGLDSGLVEENRVESYQKKLNKALKTYL